MDHYFTRAAICERLRLALSTSYRIVGSAYGSRVRESDVVELLNRARNDGQGAVKAIPSDLMTPSEIASGEDMSASGISEAEVVRWTNRRRNPAPCFRLNTHTRRISHAAFVAWLDDRSRIRRRA